MRRYDLSPLLRSSVGFDRFDRLFDAANRVNGGANAFPPYNIVKGSENDYRITMAVAGFTEADLDVSVKENTLTVTGRQAETEEKTTYLHRGIAGRAFERRFEVADDVRVAGAKLENGLLHIDLVREVPEHKQPRKIEIAGEPQVRQAA